MIAVARERGDLVLRVADLARGSRPCARRRRAAAEACVARSRSKESGSAGSRSSGIAGCSTRLEEAERLRSARSSTTSATSATGAAGTPAAVSRSRHSAVSRSRSRSRDERDELLAVPHAVGVRPEALVRRRAPAARAPRTGAANSRSFPPATMSSPSRVGKTWYGATIGKTVPWPRRHGAVGEVADEVVADVAERGLVQRRVDDGALARPLALEERRDDAERRPHPRAHVDERRADAHAGPARLAGHADEPARRLHERVVARAPPRAGRRGRTRRSSSRRAAGCARAASSAPSPSRSASPGRRLWTKTSARSTSRSTTSRPRSSRERDRERALARVHGEEHRALAVPERRAPGAAVVARVRPLDLHDVGAERGEDLGAVRPGDRRRHVDDARARERAERHRRNHRCSARMRACPTGSTSTASPSGSPASGGATSSSSRVAVVDAFFPLVPSETLVVIGGNLARSGDLDLLLVILAGAAGAIVGDNISYGIGHCVGEKTVKRWFRSEKSAQAARLGRADARRARRLHHPHRAASSPAAARP